MNHTNYWIGASVALVGVLGIGSLCGQWLTKWLTGYKPKYRTVLLSSSVAWGLTVVFALLFRFSGLMLGPQFRGLGFLFSWLVLACTHYRFLRDARSSIKFGWCIIIALLQSLSALIGFLIVLLPIAGMMRLLR
jgi:hypothetical protein